MNSSNGYSELLAQAGPLNQMQMDFTQRIQNAAIAINERVQNMMQFVQADLKATQKHEPVEIAALLASVADEFTPQATSKEQTLQFNSSALPMYVNGDTLQLQQLFRNLVGNAIKYTPQGGTVTLSSNVDAENFCVDIKDTGFGIPASDLSFIFNRFYRVRNGKTSAIEGNGLGLTVVKSIVEQHSGKTSVDSEPNKGSSFSVWLPLLALNL